jgi:surface antigen
MKISRLAAAATMAVLAGSLFQPVAAQYGAQYPGAERPNRGDYTNPGAYNGQRNDGDPRNDRGPRDDGTYQNGYRAGYDDARANRRFDDRAGYDDARANRRFDDRAGTNDRNTYRQGANDRTPDRSQLWQKRYSRVYTAKDDIYTQQCAKSADPAGVIAGALIGGLLGNTAVSGNGRTGATVAGIIVGGALGASLTRSLDCEDRSYSYKAYYDGFNGGRANQDYAWTNPKNGRRGVVRIGDYYNDPDGFRCTTFSQTIYIAGRPQEGRGRACQQPGGSWAIVG